MNAGWDINTTFAFWSLVVGIIGTALAAWAFLPGWKDYQEWLAASPDYRNNTAKGLEDQRWVSSYRDGLTQGLDWLDRRFGEAGSARALGVCTVISLCYAWAAFFLSYGLGAPGRLGDIELLPNDLQQPERSVVVAMAVLGPVVAFLLGRWLGAWAERIERWFKARLLRHHRRRAPSTTRWQFERSYRLRNGLILLISFSTLLAPLLFVGEDNPLFVIATALVFGGLFATGPILGLAISPLSSGMPPQHPGPKGFG